MQAHEVDKTCGAEPNIKKVEERLEFTKINFQRANDLKKAKVQELLSNIPNSINNNKDNLEVVTIKKLKERYN